jgi:hypothetical protein
MVSPSGFISIRDCAERNRGKAETRIGPTADAITCCASEAIADIREEGKGTGLQTPPTRQASRIARSERETGVVCRTDDWLRELFAGTYDLREAEARRHGEQRSRPTLRPETPRDER